MKLLLFGDGLWAADCLDRLQEEGHEILGVVLRQSPSDGSLAEGARQRRIPVRAPDRVNAQTFLDWACTLQPDLNISVSYDQIFRRSLIDSATLGFINAHAGKLPYYRGRNIINWAIINNEQEIGLTVHYVDEGIDTGDIIVQRTLPIEWEDDYGSVLAKTQMALPPVVAEAVRLIQDGQVQRQPQAHLEGTYFASRVCGDELIDWHDTSLNIYNKIRAITHPGPGARTVLNGQTLIIWRARYDPSWPKYLATPGEVVGLSPDSGVKVKTGDSTLILEQVQPAEKDRTEQAPKFKIGTRFGVNATAAMQQLWKEIEALRGTIVPG